MKRTIALVLSSTLLASAAFAGASVELNDANTAQIRTVLEAEGYEVSKIKIEDGMYEAYARKDGHRYEVFLNGDFTIVMTKDD